MGFLQQPGAWINAEDRAVRATLFERVLRLYRCQSWLKNGLDKILHGQRTAIFTWEGNNRTAQVNSCFEEVGWSVGCADPVLYAFGMRETANSLFSCGRLCSRLSKGSQELCR